MTLPSPHLLLLWIVPRPSPFFNRSVIRSVSALPWPTQTPAGWCAQSHCDSTRAIKRQAKPRQHHLKLPTDIYWTPIISQTHRPFRRFIQRFNDIRLTENNETTAESSIHVLLSGSGPAASFGHRLCYSSQITSSIGHHSYHNHLATQATRFPISIKILVPIRIALGPKQ